MRILGGVMVGSVSIPPFASRPDEERRRGNLSHRHKTDQLPAIIPHGLILAGSSAVRQTC